MPENQVKTPKPPMTYRQTLATDSLQNLVANLGTPADKLTTTFHMSGNFYNYAELSAIYMGWLGRRIVDLPVDEAMKKGWEVYCPSWKPEKIQALETYANTFLGLSAKVSDALKMERALGGSLLVALVDSTWGGFSNPIPDFLPGKSLINIQMFDAWQSYAAEMNFMNPLAKNYLYPESYTIGQAGMASLKTPGNDGKLQAFAGAIVHHSRVERFDSLMMPWYERQRNLYWGQSVLSSVYEAVRNAGLVDSSIATLLFHISVPVFHVQDLANLIGDDEARAALIQRINIMNYAMSANNMAIIDKDAEDLTEFTASALSGMDPILERYYVTCSAASGIPVVKLVGESAKGLNATGQGDLNNYYDMVENYQANEIKPKLKNIYRKWIIPSFFNELMPADFDIRFPAIERTTAKEKQDTDSAYLDTLLKAEERHVIDLKVVRKEVIERKMFNNFTQDDVDRMEREKGENAVSLGEAMDVADELFKEELNEAGDIGNEDPQD